MGKKVTVGYKYYLGIHMVLWHGPIDKLNRIEVDQKTAWSGNNTGGPITINQENLFGGEDREGGVSGKVDVEMGRRTQPVNSYLASRLGSNIPAYRGVCAVVLNQVYIGLNPYLKRWAFWGTRIHTRSDGSVQWYDAKSEIDGDMNAAHIIRECLTDNDWGMGYPESDIDDESFMMAADIMHSEGFGISLNWDKSVILQEFIQLVLGHIDASLYVSRTTGKFVLKLIRGGYNIDDLLVLDENSIDKVTDFKRNAVGELVNSVTVVYWDSSTGSNGSITVQDIALAAQQRATIGTTKQFPGITKGHLANRVASRVLRALSVPLASATLYTNRKASSLNVGDVFVFKWRDFGITQLAMRVVNIEMGALGSNAIKVQCVEDVFSLTEATYADPPPSSWEDPNKPPVPVVHYQTYDSPYWDVVQTLGETVARAMDPTSGFASAVAVRPSDGSFNCRIYSAPTGTYEDAGVLDFCPSATILLPVTRTQKVIPIENGVDMDLISIGTYATLGTEVVKVEAVSQTSMTVGRGCLDTVPIEHPGGTRVFFADDYVGTDAYEYSRGETAHFRLLPVTALGMLPIASSTVLNIPITSRQARPYPPGQFRIRSTYYPTSVPGDSAIPVSWAHRDRLQQTVNIVDYLAGNIGPELGTTYTCQVLRTNDSVIASHTGITGTSDSFTLAELGTNYGPMKIRLWSVRDGLASHQMHEWTFTRETV